MLHLLWWQTLTCLLPLKNWCFVPTWELRVTSLFIIKEKHERKYWKFHFAILNCVNLMIPGLTKIILWTEFSSETHSSHGFTSCLLTKLVVAAERLMQHLILHSHLVFILHFAFSLKKFPSQSIFFVYHLYYCSEDRIFSFSSVSFFHGANVTLKDCNQNFRRLGFPSKDT